MSLKTLYIVGYVFFYYIFLLHFERMKVSLWFLCAFLFPRGHVSVDMSWRVFACVCVCNCYYLISNVYTEANERTGLAKGVFAPDDEIKKGTTLLSGLRLV